MIPKQTNPPASAHVVARAQADKFRRTGRTLRGNARQLDTLQNVDGRIAATSPWQYDEWFRYYFTFRDTEKIPEVRLIDDKLELQKLEPPPQITEETYFRDRKEISREKREFEGDDFDSEAGWTAIERSDAARSEAQRGFTKRAVAAENEIFRIEQYNPRDDYGNIIFRSPDEEARYNLAQDAREQAMAEGDPEAIRRNARRDRDIREAEDLQNKRIIREREKQTNAIRRQPPKRMEGMQVTGRAPSVREEEEEEEDEEEPVMPRRGVPSEGMTSRTEQEELDVTDEGDEELDDPPQGQQEEEAPPPPETAEEEMEADAGAGPEPAPMVHNADINSDVIMRGQTDTRGGAVPTQEERGLRNRFSRRSRSVTDMLEEGVNKPAQQRRRTAGPRSSVPIFPGIFPPAPSPAPPPQEPQQTPVTIRGPIPPSLVTNRKKRRDDDQQTTTAVTTGPGKRLRSSRPTTIINNLNRPLRPLQPAAPARSRAQRKRRENERFEAKGARLEATRNRAEGV